MKTDTLIRYTSLAIAAVVLAACGGASRAQPTAPSTPERAPAPPATERPTVDTGSQPTATAGSVAAARVMKITSYDDGHSCPGNCDAHVVFRNVHNGTANAFRPADGVDPFATRTSPTNCVKGAACAICFGPPTASCLVTTYRGSGPAEGRFDVTPAFLKEWCPRQGLPQALADKCRSHMRDADRLATKVNCIANPAHQACTAVMEAAVAARNEDTPRYQKCVQMGEAAYNGSLSDSSLHRAQGCAYFKNRRHPTGNWQLLSPGACRSGYFVGKDGLDCCSADPVQAAIDPNECSPYYR